MSAQTFKAIRADFMNVGAWILDEPELHLGSDIIVSDLAGWRRERSPRWRAPPT